MLVKRWFYRIRIDKSLYTTDKKGDKVEIVIMFNDIERSVSYQKLRNNIDYFIQDAITDEEFGNKL